MPTINFATLLVAELTYIHTYIHTYAYICIYINLLWTKNVGARVLFGLEGRHVLPKVLRHSMGDTRYGVGNATKTLIKHFTDIQAIILLISNLGIR